MNLSGTVFTGTLVRVAVERGDPGGALMAGAKSSRTVVEVRGRKQERSQNADTAADMMPP